MLWKQFSFFSQCWESRTNYCSLCYPYCLATLFFWYSTVMWALRLMITPVEFPRWLKMINAAETRNSRTPGCWKIQMKGCERSIAATAEPVFIFVADTLGSFGGPAAATWAHGIPRSAVYYKLVRGRLFIPQCFHILQGALPGSASMLWTAVLPGKSTAHLFNSVVINNAVRCVVNGDRVAATDCVNQASKIPCLSSLSCFLSIWLARHWKQFINMTSSSSSSSLLHW
jgi:hypothetical protein